MIVSSRFPHTLRILLSLILLLCMSENEAIAVPTYAGCDSCADCCGRFALKSNLLHDAMLTPDIGVEFTLPHNLSIGIEGVYAWWSRDSRHRYWRIRGLWLELNYRFGPQARKRLFTGHHVGIYGSYHDFDFEFGATGYQSPEGMFGAGVSYGYSFPLNPHLRLDLSVKAGYSGGTIIKYKPECGRYVRIDQYRKHYFGITGLGVTLVWLLGQGDQHTPARRGN